MLCSYCGEFADSFDHVTPVSYRCNSRKNEIGNKYAVPCCMECNTILSSHLYVTVGSRAEYLLKRYKKKYGRVLKTPEWDTDELEEMSVDFQRSILARLDMKGVILDRISHLNKTRINDYTIEECNALFKDAAYKPIRGVKFSEVDSDKYWIVFADDIKKKGNILFENFAIERAIDIMEYDGVVTQGLKIEVIR